MKKQSVLLIGKDFPSLGQTHVQSIPKKNIAVGISAGKKDKPNEDALGVIISEQEVLLAVADGHWGAEASELAIQKASELINVHSRQSSRNEVRARLYTLFEQINRKLYDMAIAFPGAPTPETTLLVGYLRLLPEISQFYWASFGDSYLFLQHSGEVVQLNTLYRRWLGVLSKMADFTGLTGIPIAYPHSDDDHYLGVAAGLESGIETLTKGDTIFLCTDGMIEPRGSGHVLTSVELRPFLAERSSPEARVHTLIDLALSEGGNDNIACVLLQI